MPTHYDALLLVSFGGPEGADDVLPFLANVTRGRAVPAERLADVAAHYERFGGVSPINAQNRAMRAALESALAPLPVFWGNRNWHPYLDEALAQMRDAGVRRALGYVTSAYSSYSGCRQYREDIAEAQAKVGVGAPVVDKLRVFYNHPLFLACVIDATRAAIDRLVPDRRAQATLVFTAHSIPRSMADRSAYVAQLRDGAAQVAAACGGLPWRLAWQSRSGPAQVQWLEPDVGEVLSELAAGPDAGAVVVPLGFVSDHLEVVYDLDVVAVPQARALGLSVERAATPGVDPRMVMMVGELLAERGVAVGVGDKGRVPARRFVGTRGPSHDGCPLSCCTSGRPPTPAAAR